MKPDRPTTIHNLFKSEQKLGIKLTKYHFNSSSSGYQPSKRSACSTLF
jgi:hypothetical protein